MVPQPLNIKEYDQYSFTLSYDPNVPCVIMEIGGFMEGTNFRINTEKMYDLLISKGVSKLVINAENMKLIRSEDCIWVEQIFLPKALTQGLRSCAFVIPRDASAKTTIENIVYPIPVPLLNARWFSSIDEAKKWLQEI